MSGLPFDLLTAQDVADDLGCGTQQVRRLEEQGKLRIVARTRRGWRLFDPADVERLRAERLAERAQRVVR